MEINFYAIIDWLTAVILGSLAFAIFLGSKKHSSRAFVLMIFFVMIWTLNAGIRAAVIDSTTALYLTRISYFLGTLIATCFVNFFIAYPDDKILGRKLKIFLIICETALFYVIVLTNYVILNAEKIPETLFWSWNHGSLWMVFAGYFFGCWTAGLVVLFKKYRVSTENETKHNLKFMFWALLIGIIPPSFFNIILPAAGSYQFDWLGPPTGLIWIIIIGYSIVKYRQMNVRVVAAEIFTFSIITIFFLNIFTDFQLGILGRVIFFVTSIILGYFIIKGALAERDQKETLTSFNKTLNEKVAEQTVEVKRAYEVEKKANRELKQVDQNKNDFILITQHHLRTPLSQIRWYSDSIINGLYGDISVELGEVISKIDKAAEKLTKTLNDFLAITQLKIGTKVLNVQPINLKDVIETVLYDLSSEIKRKKITVSFPANDNHWHLVSADSDRMKDVFAIILDNAILYNHQEGGKLRISTEQKNGILIVNVANTGIGLSKIDKLGLLKQSFYRSKEAKKVNPSGMGVGLLVAKTIVEAHHGSIVLESDGVKKEVKIEIKLPIA